MAKPFVGKVKHKVDAKGRVSLPSNIRRVAQEGDPECEDKKKGKCQIMLMHGRKPNCLMGYSMESYEQLGEQVAQLDPYDPVTEELQDIVYENANFFEVDEAGRMGLRDLREQVGDGEYVVFVGRGQHFEIWEPEAYEAMRAARQSTSGGDPFRAIRRPINNEKPQ